VNEARGILPPPSLPHISTNKILHSCRFSAKFEKKQQFSLKTSIYGNNLTYCITICKMVFFQKKNTGGSSAAATTCGEAGTLTLGFFYEREG